MVHCVSELVRRQCVFEHCDHSGLCRNYLDEQSQAVFVFFCAVLQQSIAVLELLFASLTLF
jgi:hypothetical protein